MSYLKQQASKLHNKSLGPWGSEGPRPLESAPAEPVSRTGGKRRLKRGTTVSAGERGSDVRKAGEQGSEPVRCGGTGDEGVSVPATESEQQESQDELSS